VARKPTPVAPHTLERLQRLGPHWVSAGSLGPAAMPGLVVAPRTAPRFPIVVLGHGWLQPAHRYARTMHHLASWGFIVVAPDTERGPMPSHSGLAVDLARAVERLEHAKVGGGRVTIDASRVAAIGHGIGGSAAVLAAGMIPGLAGVATISASPSSPSAVDAARKVTVPGLHLVGTKDRIGAENGSGESLARAWAGPVQLRKVKGGKDLSVAEGTHWTSTLIGDGDASGVQRAVRSLVTAFLLITLYDQDDLTENFNGRLGGTELVELDAQAESA
jgi:dienelactone hydrolase